VNTNEVRTGFGLLVSQGLNVLVLTGAVQLDALQLAAINGFAGTALTLGFYFFRARTDTAGRRASRQLSSVSSQLSRADQPRTENG
jgi:hypothetical protein